MLNRTALALLFGLTAGPALRGADAAALWAERVQPLLDVQCVKCHGPMAQKAGLELDRPEAVLKGGDDGAVVSPGYPEKSLLYKYLAANSDPHMPPKRQLSDAERETVRTWIAAMKPGLAAGTRKANPARAFASIPEAIDTLVAEGWRERRVKPAAGVDDRVWCRRVYLDLAGRIPKPDEVAAFLKLPAGSRRAALTDQLLASDEYPVRMRELWDALLMGRPKKENQEDRRKQNGWWTYLETAFRTDRPWDETVRDLLRARPDKPEKKGASWFLYERRNEYQAIAEAVAPVVYGTKIDCAQCHDHPLAREIKQAHYWGLVAAFNRGKNVEGGAEVGESAIGGFVNFTNLKKESQPAVVTLLNGRTLTETRPAADIKEEDADDKYVDASAKVKVPKFSRREAFADAATHDNPLLARAFVNRMWAALLGRGIINPPDEMNARNAPSHPELLDWLGRDFAAHGHDVRRLVKGIVLSRVYALGGRSGSAKPSAPEAFAAAAERPLMAEQIARSWRVAAGLPPPDDTLRRACITAMPDVLPREYNASFQQAEFLANSPAIAEVLKPVAGGTVSRLAALPSASGRVREAFLAVYGRAPDREESAQAAAFLQGHAGGTDEAVRDLLWALMTSAEFLTMP